MNNYSITIWNQNKLIHHAKTSAPTPQKAKTKVLNDCLKLDKLKGTENNWLSYKWDIQQTITK